MSFSISDAGKNLEEFAAKLIVREKEALDALLASASLEANVEALSKECVAFHILSPRMRSQIPLG
jgi:hypothetical protein